jgi:beta-fructofuranosidase
MKPSQILAPWISCVLVGASISQAAIDEAPLTDKTMVVWVALEDLDQAGGTALTVNDTTIDRFDGVVFAELESQVWMPGSNGYSRTNREQQDWPKETASADQFVQVAIVYEGKKITLYRNGELYAEYLMQDQPYSFGDNSAVLFGQRHLRPNVECLRGRIRDARIYARPLDRTTIAAMEPGEAVNGIQPWAWWDFATTGIYERTGRFNNVRLTGGAKLESGTLVLTGKRPLLLATRARSDATAVQALTTWSQGDPVPAAVVKSARLLREKFLADPYRPGYHFCVPEGNGVPGDPNGCFYANGRYHLMYLYNREDVGFCWGHVSSSDLIHWRHHPDAIGPGDGDEGCFSGGGFLDEDGKAYLTYWMLWGDKGIGIAASQDHAYEHWKKLSANPVIRSTEWGITEVVDDSGKPQIYGSADPSNIWKEDGKYYVLTGNLLVLNKYGRAADAPPEMKGDRLFLFESDDLQTWRYEGVFYQRNADWTEDSEDNMCPSFLPLPATRDGSQPSDKHLLLFISHNKGCQYYVGTYDRDRGRFLPDNHGRMSWVDNTFFAPEALIDAQGRQIMWSWLTDNREGEMAGGWSGVYGLPRSLWLGDDGRLRMQPVEELKQLRGTETTWDNVTISEEAPMQLNGIVGDSCELAITFDSTTAKQFGVRVRASQDGSEETLIYFDADNQQLCFDARRSGISGRRVLEQAPFTLTAGEPLVLRVFVDRSVVEVFANDRQAICRRVYPGRKDSVGVSLFTREGEATVSSLRAWEMIPTNPY